MEGKLAD